MELVELQRHADEFRERGVRIVAAAVDSPEELTEMRDGAGAEFAFLSDADGELMDLLGMRHRDGFGQGNDIAQSASFLLAPDGTILWQKVAANYRVRPAPEVILAAIDRMDDG